MTGRIEVITGPMFSGKTEELLRRVRRAQFAEQEVAIFVPRVPNLEFDVSTRSYPGHALEACVVDKASDISESTFAPVIAIEETQFFGRGIVGVVRMLAHHRRVIVAGLDMDFQGQPFGSMPQLMAIADEVLKLTAVCPDCLGEATMSHRNSPGKEVVEVEDKDSQYIPLCRGCFGRRNHAEV